MHVIKVPAVHKFGIISHCQRLQLQTRLFEEISQEKTDTSLGTSKSNPFEVSDEFVDSYNTIISSASATKQSKREIIDKALKMFNKIKRRVGLKYNCETETHINLALGWTELSILSQCNSGMGEECLDLLLMSLDVAPINNRAFSVLFYLLETVLYFIQVHKFDQTNPNKHIKWLLVGEIVAVRIYLQCRLKLSTNWKEKLDNLSIYIKDFKKCQHDYDNFPESFLSFCVIQEVTEFLVTTSDMEPRNEETLTYHGGPLLWHAVDLCRCCSYSTYRSQAPDCIEGIKNCVAQTSALGEWIECYLAIRVVAHAASICDIGLDVFLSIVRGLTDANHNMMKQSGSIKDEDCNSGTEFERGFLLLMSALREFTNLSLLATSSVIRERSLSSLAEMILAVGSREQPALPTKIRLCVISRVEAILGICDDNGEVPGFHVIKNSLWCLLGAVKRRGILSSTEEQYSEKYGRLLGPTLHSKDLNPLPQSANGRLSNLLIQHLLPVFQIVKEPSLDLPMKQDFVKVLPVAYKPVNRKFAMTQLSKKKSPTNQKDSCYVKKADNKLKNILDNYWTKELPILLKFLDAEDPPADVNK